MLAYISKNKDRPSCLDGFPLTKNGYQNGNIWFLSSCLEIYKPPNDDTPIIKINDELSVYKLAEEINISRISKPKQIGTPIQFGDGQLYKLPKLRVYPDGTQLPTRLILTENGMQYKVKKEHLKAWNYGESLWKFLVEGVKINDNEVIEAITSSLQINYYLTMYDVLCYGLIDADLDTVISHLLDLDTWKEHIKVTDQEQTSFLEGKPG